MTLARILVISAVLTLAPAACATSTTAGTAATPAADLQHEFDARSEGLQSAEAAKDIDRVMTFWAPNAVLQVQGAPAIQGTAAIRQAYNGMLPGIAALRSERTAVAIARSGDLAYETGTNFITANTPAGPTPVTSKYVIVWTRHDGSPWLVQTIAVTGNPQ